MLFSFHSYSAQESLSERKSLVEENNLFGFSICFSLQPTFHKENLCESEREKLYVRVVGRIATLFTKHFIGKTQQVSHSKSRLNRNQTPFICKYIHIHTLTSLELVIFSCVLKVIRFTLVTIYNAKNN